VAELGAPKSKDQTERLKEVKREKVRERKGRGEIRNSTPNSFVSNPSYLFMLFNFLLANNPTKYVLFSGKAAHKRDTEADRQLR
jgi:hypothetical protein